MNQTILIITGMFLGALSWIVCPLVSDRFEPFDTGTGLIIGQSIMLLFTLFYLKKAFPYAIRNKKVGKWLLEMGVVMDRKLKRKRLEQMRNLLKAGDENIFKKTLTYVYGLQVGSERYNEALQIWKKERRSLKP